MNIDCQIEDALPPVRGNEGDVWRLAWLLVQAAHCAGPPVTVRVSLQEQKLVMRVEDSGPSVEGDQLDEVLEPFGSARPGEKSLERAAWLSIARRLKAKLRRQRRAQRRRGHRRRVQSVRGFARLQASGFSRHTPEV